MAPVCDEAQSYVISSVRDCGGWETHIERLGERNGHRDGCDGENLLKVGRSDRDQKSAFPTVEVEDRKLQHRGLHEHRQLRACAEWADPTNQISSMSLRSCRVTGGDLLDSQDTSQLPGGDLEIAVHQDEEWGAVVCLHNQCLYDAVQGHAKRFRCMRCTTMFFIVVEVRREGDLVLPEHPNSRRSWTLVMSQRCLLPRRTYFVYA